MKTVSLARSPGPLPSRSASRRDLPSFRRPPGSGRLQSWLRSLVQLAALGVVASLVAHGQEADTTPPTIVAVPSSAPNSNGWYRSSVRVGFVCSDTGGSGIATFPAPVLLSAEGAGQEAFGIVRDRAGNTSSTRLTVHIDRTAPLVTAVRSPLPGPNGWVSSPVTVTFAATDALSGVMPASLTPPIVFSTDRSNTTASGRATDRAGNTGSVSLPGIRIDMTRPRITVALEPEQTGSGWHNAPVTARFTCTDGGSGIAACEPDRHLTTEGLNQLVIGIAVDQVGLTSTVTRAVHIDMTPPLVKTTFSRPPDVSGWYTAPVTASFVCTDSLSGIYSRPNPIVISSEGAQLPIPVVALDRARNSASPVERVNLDLTPPTLLITSPSTDLQVADATCTLAGSATDAASGIARLTVQGAPVGLNADGSFSHPVPLAVGLNLITVVATDRVGRSSTRVVSVTRLTPPPPNTANLFSDPGFETSVAGVAAQDATSSVTLATDEPIQGSSSLRIAIRGYGNNVWWTYPFAGGIASRFVVGAHCRSDVSSSSSLEFCAMIYFADGSTDIACSSLSGAAGDKGQVSVELAIPATKRLQSVNLRMYQEGAAPVQFTLDEARAFLDVIEYPPDSGGGEGGSGGGGGGGGNGGGGGGAIGCPPVEPGSSRYPGFSYHLPQARPFISLASYTAANPTSTAYRRFQSAVDQAVAGHPPYAYSAVFSITMYRMTGNPSYLNDAIARVETMVAEAETAIAAGGRPALAGDSYLEVGWYLEQLALTYDSGFQLLTPGQRTRWAAFADQTLFNLWNPADATWGGVAHPWSGWSICDPGNNYHFHFLRATMLWALATQSAPLLDFLQSEKFTRLVDYYAALPGGGSREGTGYGTAQKDLFENYLLWRDSTGEDLAGLTSHARETIDYWVHATVPTRDRFAPIGDQSRSSLPELFDYHENLVHTAVVLNPGTAEAARGTWWLNNNSVAGVSQSFNLLGDLLPLPDAPAVPIDRVYHATGAGVLFARSHWNTDASWLSFVAGPYDQSHAHQDQGSFTFFKGDWLTVTPNIWSHSGINQETVFHNTIRFERADGSVIAQTPSDTVRSSMTHTVAGAQVSVTADLSPAFSRDADLVRQWIRRLEYAGDTLRIADTFATAAGVRAVFQLQLPVPPVAQPDGSLLAGRLRIVPLQAMSVSVHALPAEFSKGHRAEFTSQAGGTFALELRWQ